MSSQQLGAGLIELSMIDVHGLDFQVEGKDDHQRAQNCKMVDDGNVEHSDREGTKVIDTSVCTTESCQFEATDNHTTIETDLFRMCWLQDLTTEYAIFQ